MLRRLTAAAVVPVALIGVALSIAAEKETRKVTGSSQRSCRSVSTTGL